MHYDVNRDVLHALAADIEALAGIERETCRPEAVGCSSMEPKRCRVKNRTAARK